MTAIGIETSRLDGPTKVTGTAHYGSDATPANPAYAVLVTSAVAKGRITEIDAHETRAIPGVLDAVIALVRPIVECNRAQIDNGRTYLREMVFGDPDEPRHGEALAIVAQTDEAIAALLRRDERVAEGDAATLARIVSAVMFLSMAASVNIALSVEEIVQDIRGQVGVLLRR